MNRLKLIDKQKITLIFHLMVLIALFTSACIGQVSTQIPSTEQPADAIQPPAATPQPAGKKPGANPTAQPVQPHPTEPAAESANSQAVLLFGIGMHIEPLGSVPSELAGGAADPRPQNAAPGDKSRPDYNQLPLFERHVQDITAIARIVEQHGGSLTVQAQTPFTQMAIANGNTILSDLAQRGHEIALHFHEDAHLGKDSENLPIETWCAVMQEEISLIRQASGVDRIRYWSGGNLYPGIFDAAACAGLDVNSDWKNPQTQSTPTELIGLNPWRPAGGTDGTDLSQITLHDPQGTVVFLPEGLYERGDFASMRRSESAGGDKSYFDFLAQSLLNTLAAAQPGKVNVFHFTVHPAEFRGDKNQPFAVIENFLSEVVDPLVASGQVRWATFSEMADAYIASESGPSPTFDPAPTPIAANPEANLPTDEDSEGYISFVINVHDWVHPSESADILLKLIDLYEKYGVRGDFYFTAPVVETYVNERPDLIERLKNSDMTISYHIRPPHPLYTGFNQRLSGLSDEALYQAVKDYETFGLDLATSDLDRSRPGGYSYVAQVFGRNPVVASALSDNPRLKQVALRVYAELGAQMTVMYHEEGTKPDRPFEYKQGLLIRPSDFSVTRVTSINGSENFWWNYMSAPDAASYDPLSILQNGLAMWGELGNSRLPFITSLIHENNFYRSGPEGWTTIYYTLEKGKKTEPLSPPFNLDAHDPSKLRSAADQAAIWQAYENLVAYAAAHLQVVTSQDIVTLADNK